MDDFAFVGLTRDDGDFIGLAFAVGGFDEVEAEFSFALMLVHAVAGEAVLGQDRPDLTVEVDGGRGGGRCQKQEGGRKAQHGGEGEPSGVRRTKIRHSRPSGVASN